MNENLNISQEGIEFIASWEGLYRKGGSSKHAPKNAKLSSEDPNKIYEYIDPIGLPTIGYGHLLTSQERSSGIIIIDGVSVNYKNGLTMDQIWALKKQDLNRFIVAARKAIKVPVTQGMFDALISWSFNVGAGALSSASLMKKLNAKDYNGAGDGLLAWTKAGGRTLQGLVNRRNAERKMFLEKVHLVAGK